MLEEDNINYIKTLYRKIFDEDANNSKEFSNFVTGNPHPLRIKVENIIYELDSDIYFNLKIIDEDKRRYAIELDAIISSYIDNNI